MIRFSRYIVVFLSIAPAGAQAMVDIQDMLSNLRSLLNPMLNLILVISFVLGILMVLRGLLMMRAFSMPLTQAARPGEIAGTLVYLFVGSILIYIPTASDAVSATFFGNSGVGLFSNSESGFQQNAKNIASAQIMGYAPIALEDQWADLLDTVVLYVQFIGFIAFVRGWLLVAQSGQPGVQPGSITRGIVHVVGGILAINFLPLVDAIQTTIVGS